MNSKKWGEISGLASENTQDRLLQEAMFSSPALLPREAGVQTDDGQDCVEFFQSADRFNERSRRLSVHSDGTIAFGCVLGTGGRHADFNIVRGTIIDQHEVQQRIETFLRYSAQVYSQTVRSELISRVFFGGSLSGIRDKGFGIIPDPAPNRLGMPSHSLDDPLRFPSKPRAISYASLIDPTIVAADIVEQLRRTFKAAGGDYDPNACDRW